MPADICLSRTEVKQLTRTPQKVRQVDFLVRNGIRHYLDAHGWPVVLRSSVDGTAHDPKALAVATWTPNKSKAA